jgi:hypothetical protein
VTEDEAGILCHVADTWLVLVAKHAETSPGEAVRAVFTALALAAPGTAVTRTWLMRFIGPQAAELVKALATALGTSTFDAASPQQAQSMVGAKDAAELIGVSPQAVRLAAADGRLTATKHPVTGEWRIDRAAAERYRRQRGRDGDHSRRGADGGRHLGPVVR